MNITVKVDEVSLDTAVEQIMSYDEGGPYPDGERTVGHIVAEMIVDRLVSGATFGWPRLVGRVTEIRDEVIREAVRPQVEEAIAAPFRKTNSYGEPTGQETTLRQLIVDEAQKMLTKPVDPYSRDRGTLLSQTVAEEVKKALGAEIKEAVKLAREQVAGEIGQQVAAAVQAGLKAR